MTGTRKHKLLKMFLKRKNFFIAACSEAKFTAMGVMGTGVPKGSCPGIAGYVTLLFLLAKFIIVFYLRLLQVP